MCSSRLLYACRFILPGGEQIPREDENLTIADLNVEDGDQIDHMVEQVGGTDDEAKSQPAAVQTLNVRCTSLTQQPCAHAWAG